MIAMNLAGSWALPQLQTEQSQDMDSAQALAMLTKEQQGLGTTLVCAEQHLSCSGWTLFGG